MPRWWPAVTNCFSCWRRRWPTPCPASRRAGCASAAAEAVAILRGAGRLGQPPTRAWHLRLARHLERLGRNQEAVTHRSHASVLAPASAVDHFLLGDSRRSRGELAQAGRDFENALALQPNHFWAQYGFAFCCLRLQRLAEAKAGLTACLGHRRDFAWLYALRGFVHAELREFAAAEADFARALALKPDVTSRYAAHANRGVLRVQQAQAAEALLLRGGLCRSLGQVLRAKGWQRPWTTCAPRCSCAPATTRPMPVWLRPWPRRARRTVPTRRSGRRFGWRQGGGPVPHPGRLLLAPRRL